MTWWAGAAGQGILLSKPFISSDTMLLPLVAFLALAFHYRSFLQVGQSYLLKGVRRGARLLITGILLYALGLFMLTSFANGLAYILIWIGTSLLYIDLLPLEGIVDKRLVQGLVAIKLTALAGSFLHVWPVLISNTFDLLGVILAWLLLNSLASHQELHEAG